MDHNGSESMELGHAQNLKRGLSVASGEYIAILDSDIVILRGNLMDLCIPGKFVSAKCVNQTVGPGFISWCSVVHRSALERYPLPETGELLDDWARGIAIEDIIHSDKVEYTHEIGVSYTKRKECNSQ